MADFKNMLPAWAAYFGLRVIPRRDAIDYLFRNALHVPDWSHLLSGALKNSFYSLRSWPGILSKLQTFTEFFRTDEYRSVMQMHLRAAGQGAVASLLTSFTGSFAKWR
eukprot:9134896-Pyramimonas_sp.AAC.2